VSRGQVSMLEKPLIRRNNVAQHILCDWAKFGIGCTDMGIEFLSNTRDWSAASYGAPG
jgi:hypothetical protein